MFRFAGFELDQQRAELRGPDGEAIKLRPKTFEMLRLFAADAGRVLSKQELMDAVWPNVHVGEDSLFQCIREIRSALGDDRRQLIKLVSGRGYVFDVEVSADPAAAATQIPLPPLAAELVRSQRRLFGLRGPAAIAAVAGLCTIIGLAVAAPMFGPDLFKQSRPAIAVMPITGTDADTVQTAAAVTIRLADGLAKIENIRVVTPEAGSASPQAASARAAQADLTLTGELQKAGASWELRARLTRTATQEVIWSAPVSVAIGGTDLELQQSRLAAGLGHLLARRINELVQADAQLAATDGAAKVVVEQAIASINRTTRERFGMAQTMLQKALAGEPDNVDIAVALAALQLRGIQMVWYSKDDAIAAEAQAGAALERALQAKPNSIPVLETSCRFLSATNRFVESLVTCARALSFDPWNGLALYLVGLGQLHLGRFEDALATFRQADRFDTPQVSRWTWLLGAGWANILMGRGDDALPWLQRSIAITPASGRSHMLLAAAYQKLGRIDEAKAAMQEGLRLRPGTTALNVAPPMKNASSVFVEVSKQVVQLMVGAGLPER